MTIKMTRAEYEAKYGVQPTVEASPAPIKMTRAEYESKYGSTPQITPQSPKTSFVDKALNNPVTETIKNVFPGKRLGEAVGNSIDALTGLVTGNMERFESSAQANAKLVKPVIGDVGSIVLNTAGLGTMGAGNIVSRLVSGTVVGGGLGGTTAIANDKTVPEALGNVATGALSGLAGGAVGELAGAAIKGVPKLLAYTSEVPENAFKSLLQRREPITQAIKAGATPETALKNTRTAVRDLRKTLSNDWETGVQNVVNEFSGQRVGLPNKIEDKLLDIADDFGIDIPIGTDFANLSAKEMTHFIKKLNELPKAVLTFSPKGAVVRELKDSMKSLAVKNFGGEKGSFANLYKNYSVKKGVFDAANDIVNAYAEGKPIKDTTALNRLQNIFDENKPAYLDALLELEKTTGVDVISNITASKFKKIAPNTLNKIASSGGIATPKGITEKALNILAFPLTSPRIASILAKSSEGVLKNTANVARAIGSTAPILIGK
jgi:hypothetical protein